MSRLLLALTLTVPTALASPNPPSPVAALNVFTLDVIYWQGTFGTFMVPEAGRPLRLDLTRIGADGLLSLPSFGEATPILQLPLKDLKIDSDKTTGDATQGWRRRVLLKSPKDAASKEQRILEVQILYEVDRYEEREGRRVKLTSNKTHCIMTLHTLREDGTVREFARATHSENRD